MRGTVRERLYAGLSPCPDEGCECLLWGGCTTKKGYGVISVVNRARPVHRVAWQLEHGPVPDGLELDHVKARGCRHRNCANVAHLEAVTHAENVARGEHAGPRHRTVTPITHCHNGHEFTEANTYRRPFGRECRICKRALSLAFKRRKRARARAEAAS